MAQLPVKDQSEAAITLTIEALVQLQDPVYGYVAHINGLQQQVADLQAYRALLHVLLSIRSSTYPQPAPSWSHPQPNPDPIPEPDSSLTNIFGPI